METEFKKLSGLSLIIGSMLMVLTMVLHPSGGNIEHILNIKTVLIFSHAAAVLSLPFICFGFWGLSSVLLTKSRLSVLAFIISCFGLFAAMIAAAINGLTLPLFLSHVAQQDQEVSLVNLIRSYGHSINVPMDYILIFALVLAISVWSVLIIRGRKFPEWIGYYGLLLTLAGLIAAFNQYNMAGLHEFRIVVFGIVSWIVIAAFKILLARRD